MFSVTYLFNSGILYWKNKSMVIGSLGIFGNLIYPKFDFKYYLFQAKVDGHWVIWCFQSPI